MHYVCQAKSDCDGNDSVSELGPFEGSRKIRVSFSHPPPVLPSRQVEVGSLQAGVSSNDDLQPKKQITRRSEKPPRNSFCRVANRIPKLVDV